MTNEERFIVRLQTATTGMVLTNEERRILNWLARWDEFTVDNVVSIINKARGAEQVLHG